MKCSLKQKVAWAMGTVARCYHMASVKRPVIIQKRTFCEIRVIDVRV